MKPTVNVQTKIAANRVKISKVGAQLGTQFFQAEARDGILEFEKRKREITTAGNNELFLNRTPIRCRMTEHDIVNISVDEIPSAIGDPTVALVINKDSDGTAEVTIPVSADADKTFICTTEAVSAALKGDKTKVFSNPTKLAMQLNQINRTELANIKALRALLDKCEQGILSAISENEKKAKDYESQMIGSLEIVSPVPSEDSADVVVNITTEQ